MNNDFERDTLTPDELKELDENLKKYENIMLPESLSADSIENMLKGGKDMSQPEVVTLQGKKTYKKYIGAIASIAAVFVVVCVSLLAVKPWEKKPAIIEPQPGVTVNDYKEIEAMFIDYSQKYNSAQYMYQSDGFFDIFGAKNESAEIADSEVNMGAAAGSSSSSAGSSSSTGSVVNQSNTVNKYEYSGEYGKTNEQVKGVSEADIIKNDGKYLYSVAPANVDWDDFYRRVDSYNAYLNGDEQTTQGGQSTPGYNPQAEEKASEDTSDDSNEYKMQTEFPDLMYTCAFTIVEPQKDGKFKQISTVNITENEENIYYMDIQELYVSGDRLIALVECSTIDGVSSESLRGFYYGHTNTNKITMAVCFDTANKQNPVELWRTYQDGRYISSRLVGEQLVVLSTYGVDLSADEEQVVENCVPMVGYDMASYARVPAGCICIMEEIYDTRYLVAATLDIRDVDTLKTQAILGAGENVYCTTETLYATSTDYNYTNTTKEVFGFDSTQVQTQIYKFAIRNFDIKYLGNGSVQGSALNQFSMDEHNGYLRIATTSGTWGDSLTNQVYVLDNAFQVVGKLEGVAKGETIKSVRFTGDTGYVVTFKQTDPLFVIDLADPSKPVIKGELKIPGFSAYLHPVGDGLLLGVGADGDDDGQNGGMKVSLFDVSDPQNPVECDKVTVNVSHTENVYTYLQSDAYYTHKAICWDDANSVMYVPYVEMIEIFTQSGYESKHYGNILAVKVDSENKKLVSDGSYKVLTSYGDSYSSFCRVTYIENILMGYVSDDNAFYSFDKQSKEYLDTIKAK